MTASACPECDGPRHPGHPKGPLVFDHDTGCVLGNADDGTQVRNAAAAEEDPWTDEWWLSTRPYERRLLAAAAGIDPADVPDRVIVTRVAGSAVLRRHWPGVDPDDPTTDSEETP